MCVHQINESIYNASAPPPRPGGGGGNDIYTMWGIKAKGGEGEAGVQACAWRIHDAAPDMLHTPSSRDALL